MSIFSGCTSWKKIDSPFPSGCQLLWAPCQLTLWFLLPWPCVGLVPAFIVTVSSGVWDLYLHSQSLWVLVCSSCSHVLKSPCHWKCPPSLTIFLLLFQWSLGPCKQCVPFRAMYHVQCYSPPVEQMWVFVINHNLLQKDGCLVRGERCINLWYKEHSGQIIPMFI